MNSNYQDLANAVVEWIVKTGNMERVLSIDLETKVLEEDGFLSGETILCVSLAWFEDGKIKSRVIRLADESEQGEAKLIAEFDAFLLEARPLVLVGYNLGGYDIPLLNLKMKQHTHKIFWGIRDAIQRCFQLDMMHVVRFELARYSNGKPKIPSLSSVVEHPRFKHLPLMRTKSLVCHTQNKGIQIYEMWKNDCQNFEAYAKGDVHDVMLLFRELFL